MLTKVSTLKGYKLDSLDGQVGEVEQFKHHPATGQLLSGAEGGRTNIPKQPPRKARTRSAEPSVTIAPGLRSTRDVSINLPGPHGDGSPIPKSS